MNTEKINFRQVRDFGETFNVSIKFLRQNFKLFFLSLILIAGPFVLISSVCAGMYQSQTMGMMSATRLLQNNLLNYSLEMFFWLALFLLTSMISGLALIGTTLSFMINYMEKGPNGFTVNDVGRTLLKNIGNILLVFIIFLVFAILAGVLIGAIMAAMIFISKVLAVLFGIGLFFGILIIIPPIMWMLSATYLIKMQEGLGVFESFGRARKVMRSNFWWTWVIVFCSALAIGILGFVFALPQFIYQMVLTFSNIYGGTGGTSIPFLIVTAICTFCSTILYSTLYVINSFHYYSLAEQKDGTGLMDRINEIGNTPINNVDQQY